MLNACARRFTDFLFKKGNLDESKRKIYVYGCEIALSTLWDIFIMTLVSLLFFRGTDILAFLFFFMFTRFFTGGFHAKTYVSCFLLSNILFLACCMLTVLLLYADVWWLPLFIALFSVPIVLRYAPIRNEKHPLSEKSYKRNRIISRVLVPIQFVMILFMAFSAPLRAFYTASCVSLLANAMMILVALKRKER